MPSSQDDEQQRLALNFKWPYHANVMKMFEQVSSTMGSQRLEIIYPYFLK